MAALTFQEIIERLSKFFAEKGCLIVQPLDVEVGAGTMHPETFLRVLGPEPYNVAYVQPSRRPADGRYGENPNRLYRHTQFQVILKPALKKTQEIYIESLNAISIDAFKHDLKFEEDNWESPTLNAWGIGWQVMLDGQEITQFTYFQQAGGFDLQPVSVEITYGLERLAMFIQKKENVFDIIWNNSLTYGEIFKRDEYEHSKYSFELINTEKLFKHFDDYEEEATAILKAGLVKPAYEYTLKCSHIFNLLFAKGAISVTERAKYISRVRNLAKKCAELYLKQREAEGFPLCKKRKKISIQEAT